MNRRGIIRESGNRLPSSTLLLPNQLLPIFSQLMIDHPLSSQILADIREVLSIGPPQDTPRFEQLLGDGSQRGLLIHYAV